MALSMRRMILAVRSRAFAGALAAGAVLLPLAMPARAQVQEPTSADLNRRECDRIEATLQQYSQTAAQLEGEGLALTARNGALRAQLAAANALPFDALDAQIDNARIALTNFRSSLLAAREARDLARIALFQENVARGEAWSALLRERYVLWQADLPYDPNNNVTARRIVQNELRLGEIVRELGAAREVVTANTLALPPCRERLAILEALESGEPTEIEQARLTSPIDGVYDSYGGVLTFRTVGGQTMGDYRNQGAQVLISGNLRGDVLEGSWSGSFGGAPCNYGKVRFVFNSGGFAGFSGFCDERPELPWNGVRRVAAQ